HRPPRARDRAMRQPTRRSARRASAIQPRSVVAAAGAVMLTSTTPPSNAIACDLIILARAGFRGNHDPTSVAIERGGDGGGYPPARLLEHGLCDERARPHPRAESRAQRDHVRLQ